MKSTDIKNWNNELSYKQIAKLDDFCEILTDSISHDYCLLCGGSRVLNDGLCLECGMGLEGEDKEISNYILNNIRVLVSVKFSTKLSTYLSNYS